MKYKIYSDFIRYILILLLLNNCILKLDIFFISLNYNYSLLCFCFVILNTITDFDDNNIVIITEMIQNSVYVNHLLHCVIISS